VSFKETLSPEEAAAFRRLDMLTGDGLSRLSMNWLESGLGGASVAALAGETDATVRDHGTLFDEGLAECEVALPSEQMATWVVIGTLLRAVSAGSDTIDRVWHLVDWLCQRDVALFPPVERSPKYRPFAGERLRLHTLWGLLVGLDHTEGDASATEQIERKIAAECARVLAEYYVTPPADIPD